MSQRQALVQDGAAVDVADTDASPDSDATTAEVPTFPPSILAHLNGEVGEVVVAQAEQVTPGQRIELVDPGSTGPCPLPVSDENDTDTAPVQRDAWQAPEFDNDRAMANVEAWLATRPDPEAPFDEDELVVYESLWGPPSPDQLAAAALREATKQPDALHVAAYASYDAWVSSHPDATAQERGQAKASIFKAQGVWQ